jgi:hypothetical protein
VLALVASSCSSPAGDAQTDKSAAAAARRISSPRRHSADALVRAAVGTSGVPGDLAVLTAEDLRAKAIADPLARLVFRVHRAGGLSGFTRSEPVTACYEAMFNWYGVMGTPRRIDCPSGANAILPMPLAPVPRVEIPLGFDRALSKLLTALPAATTVEAVARRVMSALPAPTVDPVSGISNVLPAVTATVHAADVGVSLWDADSRQCLFGARLAGAVTVWRPSRVQLQPGELSCDASAALELAGLRPPH